MHEHYVVGFKDVYPWVWSVMLGVALTLSERRGAFLAAGTKTPGRFWLKNSLAVLVNVVAPSVIFGMTMIRLGPQYSPNMNLWQILGCLYLAGVPLGAHHAWLVIATKCGWMHGVVLQKQEVRATRMTPEASLLQAAIAFVVPALAAIFGWRIPP